MSLCCYICMLKSSEKINAILYGSNFVCDLHKQLGKSIKSALHLEHLSPMISFDLQMHDPSELQFVEFDPVTLQEQAENF